MTEDGPVRLPVATPAIQPEMAGFWEAMRDDTLLLPHCEQCEYVVWPPRPYCPNCASLRVRWVPASGEGVVYSYTINRRGQGYNRKYREIGPYIVAYVELTEGPRMLTNVIGCDPSDVHIGLAVRAVFEHDGEDVIIRFTPAGS